MIDLKHEIERELSRIEPPDLWDRIRADAANDAGADIPDLTTARHESAPEKHRKRGAILLVAAAIVIVAVLALLTTDADPDAVRTVNDPPTTTTVVQIRNGTIVFAADPAGGDALTSPLDHRTAETAPQPMDLYLTSGGEPTRRITSTATVERCPSYSPDGQRIAYVEAPAVEGSVTPSIVVVRVADEPGTAELRVPLPPLVDSNGLVRTAHGIPCPEWSPDGSRLAYLTQPPEFTGNIEPNTSFEFFTHRAELHVMTLDGQERVINADQLAYEDGRFAWSPNGDAIAYPAADGAWVAPLDGSAPSLVLRTDDTPIWDNSVVSGAPPRTMATAVTWSARGELAVTVLTSTLEDASDTGDGYTATTSGDSSVHVVDLTTGADETLDLTEGDGDRVAWSPDGSRLAAVGVDGHIVVHDRDDGSTATLAPLQDDGSEFAFGDVAWSPDGARLLALANSVDRGFALVSLSADGASADVLTPWTWAFEFANLDDVSWQPIADED